MASTARLSGGAVSSASSTPHRWWALAFIVFAQLMVVIDLTIMTIALPPLQRALHLSDADRQWVVTVYALAYGSLLLLGGRLSDRLGRRRALLIGLTGFAAASLLGAFATETWMMLVSRGLQGVFGALLSPSVLALIGVMFPDARDRGRAFGIVGTIMGSGAAIGLILGGALTDAFGWRAAFTINVPIAAIAAIGILLTVRPIPAGERRRLDFTGALLATGGLAALVFGASRATIDGWADSASYGPITAGLVLGVLFVVSQLRSAAPLLPMRVLRDRTRVTAMLSGLTVGLGAIPAVLWLGVYFQEILGYSPLKTGLAFLPNAVALLLTAQLVGRLMPRLPLWAMVVPGLLAIGTGLALLGGLTSGGDYALVAVPALIVIGVGTAFVLPPSNSAATRNAGADTGIAGALVVTSMQVGISFGAAITGSLVASRAADYAATHQGLADVAARATTHGIATAGLVAAAMVAVLAVTVFLVGHERRPRRAPEASAARPSAVTPHPAD